MTLAQGLRLSEGTIMEVTIIRVLPTRGRTRKRRANLRLGYTGKHNQRYFGDAAPGHSLVSTPATFNENRMVRDLLLKVRRRYGATPTVWDRVK